MQDILVVVDMQNDFIDGALVTAEAAAIVPAVVEKIAGFTGRVLFTRDTHGEDYLETQEGRKLPVAHCVRSTKGWQLCPAVEEQRRQRGPEESIVFDKPSFGSEALVQAVKEMDAEEAVGCITLVGLCTDICVISNAMLVKAALPEARIVVDVSCCAGVTPKSHSTALNAMRACQIEIENDRS